MKAIDILSKRVVVSSVMVGISMSFITGQVSYYVGWKHAAEVHAPVIAEMSPEKEQWESILAASLSLARENRHAGYAIGSKRD